jgi:hypothetical protein
MEENLNLTTAVALGGGGGGGGDDFLYVFVLINYMLYLQVLWSEPLLMKIRSSSIEICHILCRLLQSSPSTISLSSVQV